MFSGGEAGQEARGLVDTDPLRTLLAQHLDPHGNGIEGIEENIRAGRLDAFGITAMMQVPGSDDMLFYEPRHVTAYDA